MKHMVNSLNCINTPLKLVSLFAHVKLIIKDLKREPWVTIGILIPSKQKVNKPTADNIAAYKNITACLTG